jgi:arginyl-tRNA synthetase
LDKAGSVGRLKAEELSSEADLKLVLKLAEFPEAIRTVTENYFPHYLANYLYELSREVNSFYESEPVLKAEGDLRDARLHLISAVAGTLKTGLGLLGIEVVVKM